MTQFSFQDMQFHDANGVILPEAAADVFLAALAINLFLDTQDSCVCWQSFAMEATGLLHWDPVPACARRYLHLWNNNAPSNTPTPAYYILVGAAPKYVTRLISWSSCGPQLKIFDFSGSDFSVQNWSPFIMFGRCNDPT